MLDINDFNLLYSKKIVSVDNTYEVLSVEFECNIMLSIYNKSKIQFNNESFDSYSYNVSNMIGHSLASIKSNLQCIEFMLTGNYIIIVDMTNEGYTGPESMRIFCGDDNIINVWQ